MKRPNICAVLVTDDLEAIKATEPLVELFEVRIDLIGDGWQQIAQRLNKPGIACNRRSAEGGQWAGGEAGRIERLLEATGLGANIIDIELETPNLAKFMPDIKKRAKCLLSFHELEKTPPIDKLRELVQRQLKAGADICKVATTAKKFGDNLTVLQLIADFPQAKVVSFAMGAPGFTSRILCPLAGGEFTYASIEEGRESAPGQMTVKQLRKIYGMVNE